MDVDGHIPRRTRVGRRTDLANPKPNWNKTPGYTEAETSAFARILDPTHPPRANGSEADEQTGSEKTAGKFVDVWREMHPDLRHYTYFGYRFQCRSKGIGWRLDMCAYRSVLPLLFSTRHVVLLATPRTISSAGC